MGRTVFQRETPRKDRLRSDIIWSHFQSASFLEITRQKHTNCAGVRPPDCQQNPRFASLLRYRYTVSLSQPPPASHTPSVRPVVLAASPFGIPWSCENCLGISRNRELACRTPLGTVFTVFIGTLATCPEPFGLSCAGLGFQQRPWRPAQ